MLVVPRKVTPEVQQQAVPNVSQNISTPDAMFGDGGRGMAQIADAFDKLGARADAVAMDELEQQHAARTLELRTMARKEATEALYNPETGLLTRKGGNALSVAVDMQKKMAEIKTKYSAMDGESQVVRDAIAGELNSLELSTTETAMRHQFDELQSYKAEQLNAARTANLEDVSLNFNDEINFKKRYEENAKAIEAAGFQAGKPRQAIDNEKRAEYSKMRAAQIVSMVNQNTPDSILKADEVFRELMDKNLMSFEDADNASKLLKTAVPEAAAKKTYASLSGSRLTQKDEIINFVIDNFEGGDKIAQEPKGGVAKFGINSVANPDVDVKNLTREQAAGIYAKNYWDAIGADKLPESIRFIAYDTAVNHGVGAAKAMIEKSGGDPKALIDLRFKEYRRLIKEDPKEYGQYEDGWMQRLARLSETLSAPADDAKVQTAAELLDLQYQGAGAELVAMHKKTVDARETAVKLAKTAFLDEVMPVLYANNGDMSALTAAQKAKAKEIGAWDDINKFTGFTNPDIGVKVAQMTDQDYLETDFTQPQWRLSMSQSDYEAAIKKQTDLRDKPAARGEFRTTRNIVAQSWRSIGKDFNDPAYANFQNSVEDAFAYEIDAKGGKPLSTDEKRAIVSRLVLNTSVGAGYWDGRQKRVYELQPDEVYKISGYEPQVVDSAVRVLIQNNVEPTQDNIESYINSPSTFIKVDGYSDADISSASAALMRGDVPVNAATVKTFLERKNKQAAQ